jgi:N-acyl-D-aspartate/D-glutamate deacylase
MTMRGRTFQGMMFRRLSAGLLLSLGATLGAQQPYDLVIRHGRVLDGTGNPWMYADVAVTGDRIVAVGDLKDAKAKRTIDATGLYVAPGFIDVHSHAGPGLATPQLSGAVPLLAEGITTVMANPDGGGPVDLVKQRAALEAQHPAVNVGLMVPHGSVRGAVLGMRDVKADSAAVQKMRALVRAGMDAGAFGMSSGPFYAPGSFSNTEELVELSKVIAPYGGVYSSHIRDESDYTVGLSAAVDEVIRVAHEARVKGIVTHVKALGPHVWGMAPKLVARIDSVRDAGDEVFVDQYPYEASGTSLVSSLVPRWAEAGGRDSMRARLTDPAVRPRLVKEMRENLERRGGADRLQFQRYTPDPSIEGKTLQQVASARQQDPIEAAIALATKGDAGVTSFNMDEKDIATFMRQPWTMTCSDGDLVPMGQGVPHPRAYGTFPRKIRKYVVEDRVLSLDAAIHSMTGLPAAVFHVTDRGAIRPGAFADVVVFDLAKVRDKATYTNPHQLSEGMVYVLVNGKTAVDGGKVTDLRGGRVLRR